MPATERPPEQHVTFSLDEDATLTVDMVAGTPDMATWTVEFVLEKLDGVTLVTRTSPTQVFIDNSSVPKTVSVTVLSSEMASYGMAKGRRYKYKFRRTDSGARKRLAEGNWILKGW